MRVALTRLLIDILRTSKTATAKKREGARGDPWHPPRALPVLHEPLPGDSPAMVFFINLAPK
jgi:hypothetical protein